MRVKHIISNSSMYGTANVRIALYYTSAPFPLWNFFNTKYVLLINTWNLHEVLDSIVLTSHHTPGEVSKDISVFILTSTAVCLHIQHRREYAILKKINSLVLHSFQISLVARIVKR